MSRRKVRFAVVGQGHFAQVAILPGMQRARNAELVALVSGDALKRRELGDKYRLPEDMRVDYDDLDRLLDRGNIDAVYLAVPNDLHADFAVRAAQHGTHVLCEKPMAPTVAECEEMIAACEDAGAKLMIAYRLHFEAANLAAIAAITSGRLGEPRIFHSVFTQQVRDGNVRVQARPGAGPLYDLGVYCINAARYLFRTDPISVSATSVRHPGDPRFAHVDETIAATMRFPDERLATFVVSFGAANRARYEVVGTKGSLRLEHAYEYVGKMKLEIEEGGKRRKRTFGQRDQIAAEIEYFARCVLDGTDPEPSGREGLGDVRIMLAIEEAARTGTTIDVGPIEHDQPPDPSQEINIRGHGKPDVVHAAPASK